MTSEHESIKTNEFLRRRKLRLQQVREQSKDIAKKLRQRANIENLQHIEEVKSKKEKEYLRHQEKLVKRLEKLYAEGVKSVGASHHQASSVQENANNCKEDLSKIRGKEAAIELRRKKQEKLDQQKKLLDRKLLAREAANELSREKVSTVASKLAKSTSNGPSEEKANNACKDARNENTTNDPKMNKNDMATQWDSEELTNEWEPNVPALSLPRDDKDSLKESNNVTESKSERSKRLDLFALSSEMPLSLRGGLSNVSEERTNVRPSLTMVSEYLQSRALRLRENVPIRKQAAGDDLHMLKQTIDHVRSSKVEAKKQGNHCAVSTDAESLLNRKSSVTMYNHSTRNLRDISYGDADLVVRETPAEGDAYANALKEEVSDNAKDKEHLKKLQEMRSKVAITKQTVEKEYNDTMSFLKSLPKEKCSKHVRMSHMDGKRQQMHKDKHQLKLQREFNKIDRESRNISGLTPKSKVISNSGRQSKSPAEADLSDGFESRDLQYSWMPVPESDRNLAIHTIPTRLKEGKSGNTVKFSKVDSYHEYRSRHKHTPPTKDTNNDESYHSTSSSDTSSVETLNLRKKETTKPDESISDDENVIIYKVLSSRRSKKEKERKKLKLIDDVAKVLTARNSDKERKLNKDDNNNKGDIGSNEVNQNSNKSVPFENFNEGVYKVVNEKGDNITSLYFPENSPDNDDIVVQKQSGSSLRRKKKKNKQFVEELQSGSGEEFGPRSKSVESIGREAPPSSSSKTKASDNPEQQHASAATSISSFKSAANERSAVLGGDFIKLLHDNGKEAGKFYVGASGILNNDAYEITIQLKKKESARVNDDSESAKQNKTDEKEYDIALVETKVPTQELSVPVSNDSQPVSNDKEIINKVKTHKMDNNKLSDNESLLRETEITPRASKTSHSHSPDLESTLINTEASGNYVDKPHKNISEEKIENASKKLVDVGVYTTRLSLDTPHDYSKPDVAPRPATSTYTQTTLNSSNPRPVYIHMSSSTSTAYMSPPETILPKYLRQHYVTCNRRDQNFICLCQQCDLHQNITGNKVKTSKVSMNDRRKTGTPPNTARSNLNFNLDFNSHPKSSPRKHYKCRKCDSRVHSCTDSNSKSKRSYKYTIRPTSNTTNYKISEKVLKSKLHPTIKGYINNLLEINSNGLKAIEIANQECSSVSTPGSSIINVSHNKNNKATATNVSNKISLEQIKILLKEKILEECIKDKTDKKETFHVFPNNQSRHCSSKVPRTRRSVHKIKSLNISKKILRPKKSNNVSCNATRTRSNKPRCSTSSPSSTVVIKNKQSSLSDLKTTDVSNKRIRSKCSPSPGYGNKFESSNDNTCSDISDSHKQRNKAPNKYFIRNQKKPVHKKSEYILPFHKATFTAPDSEGSRTRSDFGGNTSTQTSQDVDCEINLLKMAEDKIQNMEKIADLTEKCTKRLSNLAKILEEVRKNKSSAYNHISTSDTASDNEQKSNKEYNTQTQTLQHTDHSVDALKETTNISRIKATVDETESNKNSEFISFLKDIPKPDEYKLSERQSTTVSDIGKPDTLYSKTRTKPPPALSRVTLRHGQDIIPHELSTVVEVDSPMSLKLKNESSKGDIPDASNIIGTYVRKDNFDEQERPEMQVNPDLLQNNSTAKSNIRLQDDSKIQMMDLKQFNDVMLKPFISLQEYAKQYNVGTLDEGSNMDDNAKDDLVNEELSSLHSDGSLPDVIAELLKRNIIAEPFKFDTMSNANSTTMSSESTLSVLALSKVRNNKKKPSVAFQNKENVSETSDTLSFSSNPDLENAFKKLGMGWASSTLKKTKERLALSSSTNTSSSSLSQFKVTHLNVQEIPALVTDSVLSVSKTNKKKKQGKDSIEKSKNAEQQTSLMTSMTVKEFLANELANKITFTNKSHGNASGEEFVSLLETKIPEQMKHSSLNLREEHSMDSLPSGSNNRARTSTPVQIFKSMTYHSSSSSNNSNGLFSNADDLSSVKGTSNSMRNHSTSDKGDLTIPNCSLKVRKGVSDSSKSD